MDSSSTGHAQYDPFASTTGTFGPLWLIDSDTSLHMTTDVIHLTSRRPASHITRVRIADDTPLSVSLISHLTTHSSVPNVSHVPKLYAPYVC